MDSPSEVFRTCERSIIQLPMRRQSLISEHECGGHSHPFDSPPTYSVLNCGFAYISWHCMYATYIGVLDSVTPSASRDIQSGRNIALFSSIGPNHECQEM